MNKLTSVPTNLLSEYEKQTKKGIKGMHAYVRLLEEYICAISTLQQEHIVGNF